MNAKARQILFGTFAILIIVIVSYGIFLIIAKTSSPTCFDNVQNKNEEGPDCGGACGISCEEKYPNPIKIEPLNIIPTKENTFDILFQLENKNQIMGAINVEYDLELFDSQGNLISVKNDITYLWPQEKKFQIGSSFIAPDLDRFKVKITDTQWQKLGPPVLKPNFPINLELMNYPEAGQIGFYQVDAKVTNEQLKNYSSVDVNVILFDETNKIIAVNKTQLVNLKSLEERFFKIVWFNPFEGMPARANFEVSVAPNLLD